MKPLLPLCVAALLPGLGRAADAVDYTRDVKPLLAKHCGSCHGADKQRSGLRLDTAASIRKGGDSGPAVVPGKSGDSRMIQAVTGAEDVVAMPPKGPRLTEKEIATLRAWIDTGAPTPANEVADKPTTPASKHWE